MKSRCATLALLFCFLALTSAQAIGSESENWYAFTLDTKLAAESPANVGRLVLDAPAGKHGFVKTTQNQFMFEDGTPVRFWGTNLCFSACFPSKEQAEMMADRLAFFGFNAVRLHHMDYLFEPKGILRDVRRRNPDPHRKTTSHLSPGQLDRLDYLIYQLKLRGIYVNMNLLVARHFTIADGVTSADRLGMAAKPVSFFDPTLIRLQKRYARDLLKHVNKYTGLAYSDDPAVAMVEMTNENSLFDFWKWNRLNNVPFKKDALPAFYLDQLDVLWNAWLQNKYSTPDAVQQSWGLGPNSLSSSGFHFARPIHKLKSLYGENAVKDIVEFYTSLEQKYFDEMKRFLTEDLGVRCPVTGIGGYTDLQDIKAQVHCDFIDNHAYWDHPHFPQSGWDLQHFKIHGKSQLSDAKLGFIKNFYETPEYPDKPRTMTEWSDCYPNPHAYGTPVLVAAAAKDNQWAGLFKFAFSHDAPGPDKINQINSFFDIIGNPQQLLLHSVASIVYLKNNPIKTTAENGLFTLNSDRAQGAAGDISGKRIALDHLEILAAQNGAVFLYSAEDKSIKDAQDLVLIVVGDTKNEGSGWNKEGWFDWGHGPAQLARVDAAIRLSLNKNINVYALDAHGTRGIKIKTVFEKGVLSFSTKDVELPWFELIAFE